MNKKYTILLGLLIKTIFSFSQEENWEAYMAQYKQGVGSTLVNMSLKDFAPINQLPYLLKTGVQLINCREDGLPAKEEFNVLYSISDSIKSVIGVNFINKSAGTFSYQCERMDYYYVNDTLGIRKLLDQAYQKYFPGYKYSITIREDEKWEAYLSFLYPNEETLEYMSNDKVIQNLIKEGDDLSKPRQVDHWLYFKNEVDRNKFVASVLKEKYTIESKQFIKTAKLKYQLKISRIDKVDIGSISKITLALRKMAKELSGEYDGWETFVVKEK